MTCRKLYSQVLCCGPPYESTLPLHNFPGNLDVAKLCHSIFQRQIALFSQIGPLFTYSLIPQAKKVTKGLWLLAAILSLPTAYARVNMEVWIFFIIIISIIIVIVVIYCSSLSLLSSSSLFKLLLSINARVNKGVSILCHYHYCHFL